MEEIYHLSFSPNAEKEYLSNAHFSAYQLHGKQNKKVLPFSYQVNLAIIVQMKMMSQYMSAMEKSWLSSPEGLYIMHLPTAFNVKCI